MHAKNYVYKEHFHTQIIGLVPGSRVYVYPYSLDLMDKTAASKMAQDLLGAFYSVPEIEKMKTLTRVPKAIEHAVSGKVEHVLNNYKKAISGITQCKLHPNLLRLW